MTYIEKIEIWLKEIEEGLCNFISAIRIGKFRNNPYSGVAVIAPPYFYDKNISDDQKKLQIDLKKKFSEWEEHFLLLTKNLSSDIKKTKIQESIKYIKKQIGLKSDWVIRSTIDGNIEEIKKRFEELYNIINLFKSEDFIILIPDTNSLIKAPDFERYKDLAGDEITILLMPTVLSELDKLKIVHRDNNFRKKVESVINRIKGYRTQGSLLKGVIVYKTIVIKMIAKEPNFNNTLSWLDKNNNDDRFIASVMEYQVDNPSHRVFLITSDINLQNKAEMAKLPFFETPNSSI